MLLFRARFLHRQFGNRDVSHQLIVVDDLAQELPNLDPHGLYIVEATKALRTQTAQIVVHCIAYAGFHGLVVN